MAKQASKTNLLLPRGGNKLATRRAPMAAVDETTKCAHPGCTCTVSANDEYCSQECADSASESSEAAETRCACPHPDCAHGKVRAA
jgi:hypothetical protein